MELEREREREREIGNTNVAIGKVLQQQQGLCVDNINLWPNPICLQYFPHKIYCNMPDVDSYHYAVTDCRSYDSIAVKNIR